MLDSVYVAECIGGEMLEFACKVMFREAGKIQGSIVTERWYEKKGSCSEKHPIPTSTLSWNELELWSGLVLCVSLVPPGSLLTWTG